METTDRLINCLREEQELLHRIVVVDTNPMIEERLDKDASLDAHHSMSLFLVNGVHETKELSLKVIGTALVDLLFDEWISRKVSKKVFFDARNGSLVIQGFL